MRMFLTALALSALVLPLSSINADAQSRPKSPRGETATDVGGKWITVDYGRPILRGRKAIFGEGESYGQKLNAGAPLWRLGANKSTRLNTEHTLSIGGKTIAPGEYSLFVNLKSDTEWELVVSNWGAQDNFSREDKENLWGSYGYTPDKDVVRAAMTVTTLPDISVDQFSLGFVNVSDEGGTLAVWWDNVMATVDFTIVK